MLETESHRHNDNDIVDLKGENNDNDNVDYPFSHKNFNEAKFRVLEDISEYRLHQLASYIFGGTHAICDCSAFVNPALKQVEKFMCAWDTELTDETRKIIVTKPVGSVGNPSYKSYLLSPLWKYQSGLIKLSHHYTCSMCGEMSNSAHLVVHHISYEHIGSEYRHPEDVTVLCTDCHRKIHNIGGKNEK